MNLISSKFDGSPPALGTPANEVGGSPSERGPILRHYIHVASRWRYVIIAAIVVCVLLGLVATLLMTPKYTAASTIEISRESDQVTNIQGVQREVSFEDQEFYQTQYGLLRARTLAERVATKLRLVDDSAFFSLFRVSSDDPAFQLSNGRYPASGYAARQRAAGQILLAHVEIDPTRLSRLVDIRFTSPSAEFSARVANAWAENFIQSNLERKVQATVYGRDLLKGQLAEAKEKLDESQRQLVNYASKEQIIDLPAQGGTNANSASERSIVADNLASLNSALSKATADRIEAEARYRKAGQAGASAQALSNSAINGLRQSRAELAGQYQRLMQQFEPGYPAAQALKSQIDELDRSIAKEEARVTGSYLAEYRQSLAREHALQAKVNSLKSNYLDLRRRSIQYNIYQQEVDTNRVLYDALLQRYKEIGVAGGVGVNNVAVVDAADVPQKPSSPRLVLNLAVSILAGLALGALAAFSLEQLDEALIEPSELERLLGIALLGSVPKVKGETPREALLDRKSELVDAYMAVQTNLGLTTEHGIPRSLAITSTRPSEGKTTTALALAATLARGGRKVMLIDGDMRAPSIHKLGGVGHEKGLSNFLAGEDDISSLVFKMSEFGFEAISAGPIPPNAAELLTSARLNLLISELLKSYDHVIIDAPPVMGLADAPLIASRVEGVIFAVESHSVAVTMVKNALRRLASANTHVIGCVMTKFEASKARYDYEYGYTYGREIGTGVSAA